jgi:hypothetical protein
LPLGGLVKGGLFSQKAFPKTNRVLGKVQKNGDFSFIFEISFDGFLEGVLGPL